CCIGACVTGGACGATGCDATGACVYPNGGCRVSACSAGQLTPGANCGGGSCPPPPSPTPCPGNVACAADGKSCLPVSCTQDADCSSSAYYCDATLGCQPKLQPGMVCTSAHQCGSGDCRGRCCVPALSCVTTAADPCGTDQCSDTGQCAYPTNACR